jgi:hypothetical protein
MSEVEKEGEFSSSACNIVLSPKLGKLMMILEHIHVKITLSFKILV